MQAVLVHMSGLRLLMRILPELTAAQAASDELAWELRWKRRNERGRVCSGPRF